MMKPSRCLGSGCARGSSSTSHCQRSERSRALFIVRDCLVAVLGAVGCVVVNLDFRVLLVDLPLVAGKHTHYIHDEVAVVVSLTCVHVGVVRPADARVVVGEVEAVAAAGRERRPLAVFEPGWSPTWYVTIACVEREERFGEGLV